MSRPVVRMKSVGPPGGLCSALSDSGMRIISEPVFRQMNVDQVVAGNHGGSET